MTKTDHWKKIQEVFQTALLTEDRSAYLAETCRNDAGLRAEVEALLAAHEKDTSFLNAPAWEQSASLIADPNDETAILPQPKSFSHYEIISLLGKGGMGEVYLASDTKLGRKAALKILPEQFTTEPDLVARFEREARAASALNHPNILTVYEIGESEKSHFIATEFIEGLTLRQRLGAGKIPLNETMEICVQIAAALTAAHEAGIIHRDIKPENIMLRPDGYVKVLDFGLAKLIEASLIPDDSTTQTGMIMGTPSYMSPEQARGQKVDHRTDIWSLGVVLHEMISGVRPFTGQTRADLMVSILDREPTPLPDYYPLELRQVIAKSLAKDPAQRLTTVKEFGQELKELRHQLEFAKEIKHLSQEAEETIIQRGAETEKLATAQITQPELNHERISDKPAVSLPAPIATPSKFPTRAVMIGVLIASLAGVGGWYFLSLNPANSKINQPTVAAPKPVRELTWWLTAQRMRDKKNSSEAVQSAGNDWFPNGTKFKFNLVSPQTGYLYLLNEGLTSGGEKSLNLLYPTPKNNQLNAAVKANQPIQTDNYVFDENEGTEKFWIVWATTPVAEIEAAKASATPAIKNNIQSAVILAFLNQHTSKSTSAIDESKVNSTVTTEAEFLVKLVNLKHH